MVATRTGRTSGELEELSNLIRSFSFDFNSQEKWIWSLASNGLFEVKKLSSLIDEKVLGFGNHSLQATLRNNLMPKKLKIHVWRLLLKRIPVRIKLNKRGIDLHSVRCPICDDDMESLDHSLFKCKVAIDVWFRVYKWWNFSNCATLKDTNIFRGKSPHTSSPIGLKIWKAVEWVCAYFLWKNRNATVYQNKGWSSSVLLNEFQVKSFEWISCKLKDKSGKSID
ncbi:uncharacterized protein [Rutidosis leptorrhynchoides]|uniref:uncharacterized protein n=1 Tax=Rutidosis leptorrhynchoides TaxID=125765 RepID=UPI003A98DEA7